MNSTFCFWTPQTWFAVKTAIFLCTEETWCAAAGWVKLESTFFFGYKKLGVQCVQCFFVLKGNFRVFIKEWPQQEESETSKSKDTQFAAVKLPKCLLLSSDRAPKSTDSIRMHTFESRQVRKEGTREGTGTRPYYLVNHHDQKNEGPFGEKKCTEIEK